MVDALKFDVRVRERLLKKGLLSETEVEQYLGALPDSAENAVEIGIKQPALQTEAEREVLVVRTLARPAQPTPPRPFDEEDSPIASAADKFDADIDDDDDDDDDFEAKPAAEAAPAPAPAPAPAVEASPAPAPEAAPAAEAAPAPEAAPVPEAAPAPAPEAPAEPSGGDNWS